MPAVSGRDAMISGMAPVLRAGRYVFVSVPGPVPEGLEPIMTFREDEGLTLILPQQEADQADLGYNLVLAWITLRVHSSLEGVGLTAAVSSALAESEISCNVVAAAFHDHLFVPADRADQAVRVLVQLAGATPADE
ncbi:MAG: ACT domain-containing protein [Candidatus Nanopelagicales bacterium]|nr:ACT domain-containing protein [Candidatus Nanopelagicales bacterium]